MFYHFCSFYGFFVHLRLVALSQAFSTQSNGEMTSQSAPLWSILSYDLPLGRGLWPFSTHDTQCLLPAVLFSCCFTIVCCMNAAFLPPSARWPMKNLAHGCWRTGTLRALKALLTLLGTQAVMLGTYCRSVVAWRFYEFGLVPAGNGWKQGS